MTKRKIKIIDDDNLRDLIDKLYDAQSQITICKWSLEIAKHIMDIISIKADDYNEVRAGFEINELWQLGNATVYDVRKVGFEIHHLAANQSDEIKKTVFRVIGQAVSSAHMKEHGMVCSDYAIKVINLKYNNDINKVIEERNWQFQKLQQYSKV